MGRAKSPHHCETAFNSKIIFMVEGGDDVAFLQGFFRTKKLIEKDVISVVNNHKTVIEVQKESTITLASLGGIDSLDKEFEQTIRILDNRRDNNEKDIETKAIIVLVDSSNDQDEAHIKNIQETLRKYKFPCPDLNQITQDQNSSIQFGLYVLKDLGGAYNDLESIAIHTLKESDNFKQNVHFVLDTFKTSTQAKGLDISHKQSKRELAVCLATFPKYEGNPRPVLRDHFSEYFNVKDDAFKPLNTLLESLNEQYNLYFEEQKDNTLDAQN
jgi:hypothetical protein